MERLSFSLILHFQLFLDHKCSSLFYFSFILYHFLHVSLSPTMTSGVLDWRKLAPTSASKSSNPQSLPHHHATVLLCCMFCLPRCRAWFPAPYRTESPRMQMSKSKQWCIWMNNLPDYSSGYKVCNRLTANGRFSWLHLMGCPGQPYLMLCRFLNYLF